MYVDKYIVTDKTHLEALKLNASWLQRRRLT